MRGKLLVLIASVPIIFGCISSIVQEDDYIYDKIYVSNVAVDDTVKFGQTFEVKIYGMFPSTGWEFYKIDVKESEYEITITPIARIRKGIVALEVLVPCSTSVELTAKTPSESLKISAVGKTETVEKIIKVIHE